MKYVVEKITTIPSNLRLYVSNRIKNLTELHQQLERAKSMISNSDNGCRLLEYFYRYGTDYEFHPSIDGSSLIRNFERAYPLEDLIRNLNNYLQYGKDWYSYCVGTIERRIELYDDYKNLFIHASTVPQGSEQYGYEPNNPANNDDHEFVDAMKLYRAILTLGKICKNAEQIFADITEKFTALAHKQSYILDPHRYKPKHEAEEELYHATIYANDIAKDGFLQKQPPDRHGLGNYGNQTTISFTHSIKIAHDIYRCLRELWMIAHGNLSYTTILKWFEAEKLTVPNDIKQDEYRTANLYRAYLWHTNIRGNPVFANITTTVDILKKRKMEDIGILKCKVRLDDDVEYHHGEAEFRLSADRVITVTRIM